jgi:hypothetical protein
MVPEHAEIRLEMPPAPIQNLDAVALQPTPEHERPKTVSDDMLLLGMMLWMEQGLVLEWINPTKENRVEEDKNDSDEREGHPHD